MFRLEVVLSVSFYDCVSILNSTHQSGQHVVKSKVQKIKAIPVTGLGGL
jgi:hypothetical protein